jgi:hypothetical protein
MTIFDIAFMGLLLLNSFYIWGLLEHKNKVKESQEKTDEFKTYHRATVEAHTNRIKLLEEELVHLTKYVSDNDVAILNLKDYQLDIEKELAYRNIPMEKGLC